MPPFSELPIPNLFLASLPQDDFEALRPHFERVRLTLRQILHEMGSPIEHCYFTDGGMTSLVVRLDDGASIEAGILRDEMLRRPTLLQQVLRFTQVLNVQIAHTAACNAHHELQERLARWLLMAHDRAES